MFDQTLGSHRIGRALGIEVRVLYTLYLVTGLYALSMSEFFFSIRGILYMVLLLAGYPFFIFLHELGHSLAAIKEGLGVRKILLHPLGGLAMLEGRIPGPGAEIFIALAGPFVNLFFAAIFFLPLMIFRAEAPLAFRGGLGLDLLVILFFINIVPALFNFLPIFPMDGGRVTAALSILLLGEEAGLRMTAKVARIALVLMALVGGGFLFSGQVGRGITLIVMAGLLHYLGRQELQARTYAASYSGIRPAMGYGGGSKDPWAMPEWSATNGFETKPAKKAGWFSRWQSERQAKKEATKRKEREELNQQVDQVLAKVKNEGIANLTPQEKDLLNRASKEYK